MDNIKIADILPQRYPFLLIDRVLEFEKGKRLVALKNVTMNEEFFQGHFPSNPVMPGVLIIEAMGQAGMLFLSLNKSENSKNIKRIDVFYLSSVKARFKRPVVPGDRLLFEVIPVKVTSNAGIIKVVAKVDDEIVVKAELAGSMGE